ncbi:hypothetical protein C8R43DRAFT_951563 [Mycena crocata]|nr:hypothetical protein C8R43DRAFT_951563 [Mycena crocata]
MSISFRQWPPIIIGGHRRPPADFPAAGILLFSTLQVMVPPLLCPVSTNFLQSTLHSDVNNVTCKSRNLRLFAESRLFAHFFISKQAQMVFLIRCVSGARGISSLGPLPIRTPPYYIFLPQPDPYRTRKDTVATERYPCATPRSMFQYIPVSFCNIDASGILVNMSQMPLIFRRDRDNTASISPTADFEAYPRVTTGSMFQLRFTASRSTGIRLVGFFTDHFFSGSLAASCFVQQRIDANEPQRPTKRSSRSSTAESPLQSIVAGGSYTYRWFSLEAR